MFVAEDRGELLARLRRLVPDEQARWGRMTAPQMVAHLIDQMGHTLGDKPCRPVGSFLRTPALRYAAIYLIPWPKGRVKGPPDAFVTTPSEWEADIERLVRLVERMGGRDESGKWPDHGLFGRMRGKDWGHFCYKHFDHHLRQFGR